MSRPASLVAAASVAAAAAALAVPSSAGAVFHGTPVPASETPWLVSFLARDVACGGALIAPNRVLTAAHCVQGVRPGRLRVRLGGGELGATRLVGWKGAVFPSSYRSVPSPLAPEDPLKASTVDDVAVVVLDRPVSDVPVVPLAVGVPAPGQSALTVGRGRTGPAPAGLDPEATDPGRPSHVALGAAQVVETGAACGAAYGSALRAADHLCTIDRSGVGAQACGGDSGSPVLVRGASGWAVAGVVAWGGEVRGRDCGEGLPDVSERVAQHATLLAARALPAAFAPWAERRVRVRRVAGGKLRCVIGTWGPGEASFSVAWWRAGKRRTPVSGTTAVRADRPGRLGCTVTARTAGGWAEELSYNAL